MTQNNNECFENENNLATQSISNNIIHSDFDFNLIGEYIHIQFLGDGSIAFEGKQNIFNTNTGLTIQNPQSKIPVYYIQIVTFGSSLLCGNIIDNINAALLANDLNNIILVIDFEGVKEVNQSFCEEYLKYLLITKNKIITINQNIEVSNIFAQYVINNIETQEL